MRRQCSAMTAGRAAACATTWPEGERKAAMEVTAAGGRTSLVMKGEGVSRECSQRTRRRVAAPRAAEDTATRHRP